MVRWPAMRVGIISPHLRRNLVVGSALHRPWTVVALLHMRQDNSRESSVSIDLLHTTFGILFTFVWLFVGQILVAGR